MYIYIFRVHRQRQARHRNERESLTAGRKTRTYIRRHFIDTQGVMHADETG